MEAPKTLSQAIVYFSDPDRAFEYAKQLRWPDGKVACPRCDSPKNSFIKTRRIWFCYGCQKQFTLKVGTIFEDSALGLDKWMTATWMLVNCKNGISSYEIASTLGITQKSAWFMLHRIRKALQDKSFVKLGGSGSEVEVDETFIGGKARNMHKAKKMRLGHGVGMQGGHGKAIVMGMLERDGQVRTRMIPDRKKDALHRAIMDNIDAGSLVYTDELVSYPLFRYVDEQAFRYNNRKDEWGNKISPARRFSEAMAHVAGHRLTYSDLTGKSDSPHMPETGTGTAANEPF